MHERVPPFFFSSNHVDATPNISPFVKQTHSFIEGLRQLSQELPPFLEK